MWKNRRTTRYQVKFNAPSVPSVVWYYFITIQDKVYYYGNDMDRLGSGRLLQKQFRLGIKLLYIKKRQRRQTGLKKE